MERIFKQTFADGYQGIDAETSILQPDSDSGFARAINYEKAVSNSLRGRVGCQTQGSYGFFGLFRYNYTRTQDEYAITYQVASGTYPNQVAGLTTNKTSADGASRSKLIAINQQLWVQDTFNYAITRVSGSYPFTWYSAVSGSSIHFIIKANGTSILDVACGDGNLDQIDTSVYSLLGSIDATAELSISRGTRGTCPPFAIVNGAQTTAAGASTTYGTRYTVTVNNTPHTFQAGDIITFPDAVLTQAGLTGTVYGIPTLVGGFVISTTATTITYVGPQVTLTNGSVLGYMGQSAAAFPIAEAASISSGATFSITMPYWRLIPEGDKDFGHLFDSSLAKFIENLGTPSGTGGIVTYPARSTFYAPPVAENSQGCLYIASSGRASDGVDTFANNLIRTDGVTAKRAGLPGGPDMVTTLPAGALAAGTYKYKAYYKYVDAQGNIIEGQPGTTYSVTTTGAENVGISLLTSSPAFRYSDATGYLVRSCYKHTLESPAAGAFFYVDDNSAAPGLTGFLQPGDPVTLNDNTAPKTGFSGPGTLHRTVCTDYCAVAATISPTISSIKVADSSGYTIPDNAFISSGLTVVLLRTTAGGNQFYVLNEMAITGYANLTGIVDSVSDATLSSGTQYTEITIGKEHNPPPACSLVCQHQGNLFVARGVDAPSTITSSTSDGIEYFPLASNGFDVPSTEAGFITAIASDTNDRLAVTKESAYYDVVGDVDGGVFSINAVTEGDYGVSTQASLRRVKDALVGVSKQGLVVIQNGRINQDTFAGVNAKLIGQSYYFNLATAYNDGNGKYVCTIPVNTTQSIGLEPVSFVVDYSKMIGDSLSPVFTGNSITNLGIKTFESLYPYRIDQIGGAVTIAGTTYHLSGWYPYGVFKSLPRFSSNSPANGDGDSFIDNVNAITYILEWNPINFGEPAQLKTPIRARVWSFPNNYAADGWVPFAFLLETGASPLASLVGGVNPNSSSSTLTFTASTNVFREAKVKNCKTNFYIIRLTTNTIRTAPFLTGLEMMFDANYPKEDVNNNG